MNSYALVYYLKSHIDEINNIRHKYDPMAYVINPHITIVFPISENDINEDTLVKHIQNKIINIGPFLLEFDGLERSWDNYLFLMTKTGTSEMDKFHDFLYTEVLAPFLRKDIPFTPHVTLGVFQQKEELYTKAENEVKQTRFSFTEIIDNISFIKGDGKLPPQTIRNFLLQ